MARYAVIRIADGTVVNVVLWDGGPQWAPQSGHIAIASNTARVGDHWDGSIFTTPPYVPTPEEAEDIAALPIIQDAITFRDRTDYIPEPSLADLPVLSGTATAAQTRDYIIANVIPRINTLSTAVNVVAPRVNVLMVAIQKVIKVLLYMGKRLMGITNGA